MSGQEARRRVLRDGAAVRLVFGLSTPTESGTITVMIPQRVLLVQRNGGAEEETSSQTEWHERFSEEVMRSAVTLEATMPLARMTLGDLARLHVGQVLDIEENAQGQAQLSARNKTLFVCEFGKLGQNYTVRIKQPFDAGQDFIDGLMPGVLPPSYQSLVERRTEIGLSSGQTARMAWKTSSGYRARAAWSPPYSSSRRLVSGDRKAESR